MKKIFSTLAITLFFTSLLFGQVDKDYCNTLKKMFEVSGAEETYKNVITQMISIYKQEYTDIRSEFWKEIENELLKTSLSDLAELLVPVYNKYMTKEDLESIIEFYESPIGKKFAKNQPMIVQESMQVGQQWGKKLGQEIANKILKQRE